MGKQMEDITFDPPSASADVGASPELTDFDTMMSEMEALNQRNEMYWDMTTKLAKWIDSTDTLKQRIITDVLGVTQETWDAYVAAFDEEDDAGDPTDD